MWLIVSQASAGLSIAPFPHLLVWNVEEGALAGEEADGVA